MSWSSAASVPSASETAEERGESERDSGGAREPTDPTERDTGGFQPGNAPDAILGRLLRLNAPFRHDFGICICIENPKNL